MYISDLFKKSLLYAKKHADNIFILSAKYGLLALDEWRIGTREKNLGVYGISAIFKTGWQS